MCPSGASSEKYAGLLFYPLHLDFDDFEKQMQGKADFIWDFFKKIILPDANDHKIPWNYTSRYTKGTDSERANPGVLGEQRFWRPGTQVKCWAVSF